MQIKLKEEEKKREVEVMKEHYSKKIEEAMKKGSMDSSQIAEFDK